MFLDNTMLYRLPALLVAIVIHEYSHGRMAEAFGDRTARYSGRLTLNPLAHLDIIGLLMLWVFGFGWAKPVPINPYNFRDRRLGLFWVSVAGPLSNVAVAAVAMIISELIPLKPFSVGWWLLRYLLLYNVYLSVFNLIPIPPLDGSKVLMAILPGKQAAFFYQLETYGWVILLVTLYTGWLQIILNPLVNFELTVLRAITAFLT